MPRLTRRTMLIGTALAALSACAPAADTVLVPVPGEPGPGKPTEVRIPRSFLPTEVEIANGPPPGEIFVDIAETWLYLGTTPGQARRYKIAVGASGRNFTGRATVGRKAEWPSWTPTANMIRQEPDVYGPVAGGLPGGDDRNPMGSRALYLYQGSRDTLFRIHGTPQPWTIGRAFSSGCIRMVNEHAIDLYDRVPVGTVVTVA